MAITAATLEWPRRKKGRPAATRPATVLGVLATVHLFLTWKMKGGQLMYVYPAFPLLALAGGLGVARLGWLGTESLVRKSIRVRLAAAWLALTIGAWALSSHLTSRHDQVRYPFLPYLAYLKTSHMQRLRVAELMAREILASQPTGSVYGDAPIAAEVALRTGLRVAAYYADLPTRWISMNLIDREWLIDTIEADAVEFFVTPFWFFMQDPRWVAYLKTCYDDPKIFDRMKGDGSGIPRVALFRHKREPRPCR